MTTNSQNLGTARIRQLLKTIRTIRGYNQKAVAQPIGITQQAYASVENGHSKTVRLAGIERFCAIFDIAPLDFFELVYKEGAENNAITFAEAEKLLSERNLLHPKNKHIYQANLKAMEPYKIRMHLLCRFIRESKDLDQT